MEITRETELVTFFHLDARNFDFEKEHGAPDTSINVQTQILRVDREQNFTEVKVTLHAIIVLTDYTVSANLSQVSRINERAFEQKDEMTGEELQELAEPVIVLLQRLTYEATESTFGEGIQLIL